MRTFAPSIGAFFGLYFGQTHNHRDLMANPVGRPRTTTADLPEDWQEIMRECGQEGGSAVEARCLLGIGDSAWGTLLEDSEEFRRTEKERQALCEVWWERRGRKMAMGDEGNATVWIFNMKNRFGWRDRHDLNHESESGSMTPRTITATDPVEASKQYQDIMGGDE